MTSPRTDPTYDPLPLTTDDHIGERLYNAPHAGASSASLDNGYDPVEDLGAPRPRFLGGHAAGGPEMRASYASSQHTFGSTGARDSEYNNSVYNLQAHGGYRDDPNAPHPNAYMDEKRALYASPKSRRKPLIWGAIIALLLIVAGVVVAVYFTVIKPKNHTSSTTNGNTSSSSDNSASGANNNKPSAALVVTGGDGSTVTMDDGSTFTYNNSFGGYWYADPNDPYKSAAKCNSWTPALNETFKYGEDRIFG
jgi:glucan 1,3-beta-glucosidase